MSLKDFEIITKIGEGSYSTVYKVKRITDDHIYALKKVRLVNLKEKEKRNALNEIRILASVKHPNIISYKEAFFDEDSKSLCLVMEFADGGDLYQRILLYQKKGVYMSESFVWNLIIQLCRGLEALHDLNILHRDLKCANVFLCKDGKVKLGDMNVSKVSKDCIMHTQTGTPYYASPEVWKDIPYDTKSDLWSLGCVLYEAVSLKPPFRAEDMEGLYKKIVKGEYSNIPRNYSTNLQQVISGLLQVNPHNRLTCRQILNLPSVLRHINTPVETTEYSLLQTIKFPKNFQLISKHLPEPTYIEPKPNRNKSSIMTNIRKESLLTRDSSESKYKKVNHREKSDSTNFSKKIIQKENFKIIRLPIVKAPYKKYSAKSLISKVDITRNETLSRKPSTNRSFLLPAY
jgi:NIMA (never in mitosis gene a)-related kinase 1/4/5